MCVCVCVCEEKERDCQTHSTEFQEDCIAGVTLPRRESHFPFTIVATIIIIIIIVVVEVVVVTV